MSGLTAQEWAVVVASCDAAVARVYKAQGTLTAEMSLDVQVRWFDAVQALGWAGVVELGDKLEKCRAAALHLEHQRARARQHMHLVTDATAPHE